MLDYCKHHLVESGRADALFAVLINFQSGFQRFMYPLFFQYGSEDDWYVVERGELFAYFLLNQLHALFLAFDEIPLVDQ